MTTTDRADRRYKKITPSLEKEILARAADGHSARRIAEWLGAERDLKITHQAVGRLLRVTRQVRADVTKAVVREQLAKTVTNDIDVLSEEQERCRRLSARLHTRAHALLDALDKLSSGESIESSELMKMAIDSAADVAELALKASDRVKTITDRKLHYAGADEASDVGSDGPTPQDAARQIRAIFGGKVAPPEPEVTPVH